MKYNQFGIYGTVDYGLIIIVGLFIGALIYVCRMLLKPSLEEDKIDITQELCVRCRNEEIKGLTKLITLDNYGNGSSEGVIYLLTLDKNTIKIQVSYRTVSFANYERELSISFENIEAIYIEEILHESIFKKAECSEKDVIIHIYTKDGKVHRYACCSFEEFEKAEKLVKSINECTYFAEK